MGYLHVRIKLEFKDDDDYPRNIGEENILLIATKNLFQRICDDEYSIYDHSLDIQLNEGDCKHYDENKLHELLMRTYT